MALRTRYRGGKYFSRDDIGQGYERTLLQEFPKVVKMYEMLSYTSKEVIEDVTKRMGCGMAEFVGKDLGQGLLDAEEYQRYCHFVAGLVGEGLTRLFTSSGLEHYCISSMSHSLQLSNQMGLFLQKTNIIRDYLEDYVDGRAFWPQSVWKQYSPTGNLGYFANVGIAEKVTNRKNRTTKKNTSGNGNDNDASNNALKCLNELVTDALEHVPDCIAYLNQLQCKEIFRFCAIPQVMAIATLAKCYHNVNVFTGVVKIRKGLSCKLILYDTHDIEGVCATFHTYANTMLRKAYENRKAGFMDPTYERTIHICDSICQLTKNHFNNKIRKKRTSLLSYQIPFCVTVITHYCLDWNTAHTFLAVFLSVWILVVIPLNHWRTLNNLTPARDLWEDYISDCSKE